MSKQGSFDDAMALVRAGDEEAAARIFSRFAQKLTALARQRLDDLDKRARRTVDGEDVVQSALGSFFRRCAEGQFDFADWNGVEGLLVRVTLRKCGRKVRDLRAACRDIAREVDALAAKNAQQDAWEAASREPTAEESAMFSELLGQWLGVLDEVDRQIMLLWLDGYRQKEIAQRVGYCDRHIRRVQDREKQRLREMLE